MRPNRQVLRRNVVRMLLAATRRAGHAVVRDDFYSPIVDTKVLPEETWRHPAPMPGLELDLQGQLTFLTEELAPFMEEFRPPVRRSEATSGFHLDNPMYGPMDAHVLYAMLRHLKPERVLELGSGYSTLVIERALAANRLSSVPARHVVVDPLPSPLVTGLRGSVQVRRESAASVDAGLFDELEAGDVLFVDTSHVVRPGGEVVRIVLETLPALRSGVVIHLHDFFRPFEYPRILYDEFNVHWQEQYLVQALLSDNAGFEVMCANHALWRFHRGELLPLFPHLREGMEPSALWIARR